ncbi:hypothetical protein AGMMS50293_23090 [Spirochaetia bacterium]|nr:hypothetical protein AGMMS50293_23090 [Spirochaetia bacterium]
MRHEKSLRLVIFIVVAALHAILILFLAFNVRAASQEIPENARVMKLTDLAEAPPPPPSEMEQLPQVESIAETMIETDTPPPQTVVAAGTLVNPGNAWEDYLPAHNVSTRPEFDEKELAAAIVYPSIAQRSGIEGRVILELFVDKNGFVQRIQILQETPQGRGFGEAAVRAFTGRRAAPARANGEAVSCRYRYPVTFKFK